MQVSSMSVQPFIRLVNTNSIFEFFAIWFHIHLVSCYVSVEFIKNWFYWSTISLDREFIWIVLKKFNPNIVMEFGVDISTYTVVSLAELVCVLCHYTFPLIHFKLNKRHYTLVYNKTLKLFLAIHYIQHTECMTTYRQLSITIKNKLFWYTLNYLRMTWGCEINKLWIVTKTCCHRLRKESIHLVTSGTILRVSLNTFTEKIM